MSTAKKGLSLSPSGKGRQEVRGAASFFGSQRARLTIDLTVAQHQRFKKLAADKCKSMRDLVVKAIESIA